MITAQWNFVALGFLGTLLSIIIFIYLLWKNNNAPNTIYIYIITTITHTWFGLIYFLALIGVIPFNQYGNYIRPSLFLVFLAPAFIALALRKQHK